jgi:hypothetical protein
MKASPSVSTSPRRSRLRSALAITASGVLLLLVAAMSAAKEAPGAEALAITPAAYQSLVGAESTATGKIVTFVDKQPTTSLVAADQPDLSPPTSGRGSGATTTSPKSTAAPTSSAKAANTTVVTATTTPAVVTTASPATTAAPAGVRCVVRLHGKGGYGSSTSSQRGSSVVSPTGNSTGWGGMQWLYGDTGSYASARAAVASAITGAGCGHTVVYGFSNGASFAASLYCHGETFGGRVAGYVVDDPVTDHAGQGCAPAAGVRVAIYWTGALEPPAVAGWACSAGDWTCQGGTTIGIDAYAASLGTSPIQSPYSTHDAYVDAPQVWSW